MPTPLAAIFSSSSGVARRGGRRAAQDLGVDGLIPLLVLQLLLDIGRQGHFAQVLQHLQEDALVVEAHHPVAVGQLLHHLGGQFPVAEAQLRPCTHLPARAHQALPGLVAPVDQQQHLAGAAAGQPLAQQAGGQHPGVVQNQAVAGIQKVRQLVEVMVTGLPCLPVQRHQAGGVPLVQGRLGDQLLRKVIVKIACFHGTPVLTGW